MQIVECPNCGYTAKPAEPCPECGTPIDLDQIQADRLDVDRPAVFMIAIGILASAAVLIFLAFQAGGEPSLHSSQPRYHLVSIGPWLLIAGAMFALIAARRIRGVLAWAVGLGMSLWIGACLVPLAPYGLLTLAQDRTAGPFMPFPDLSGLTRWLYHLAPAATALLVASLIRAKLLRRRGALLPFLWIVIVGGAVIAVAASVSAGSLWAAHAATVEAMQASEFKTGSPDPALASRARLLWIATDTATALRWGATIGQLILAGTGLILSAHGRRRDTQR